MANGVLGLRGTGNLTTNELRENWRDGVLFLEPNGSAPLFALTSQMSEERLTEGSTFHWWTKTLESQTATVTGVYTNATLATAYVSGGTAGQTLYFKMSAADASHLIPGLEVSLRDASDVTNEVIGKITAVQRDAGALSYVAAKLLEADDNGTGTTMANCDTLIVIGSIHPEAGERPAAISEEPVEHYNYAQNFRTALEISRELIQTKLRTGDRYQSLKADALRRHSMEIEKAFLFGIRTSNTGTNGHPEKTTLGLIPWIKADAPANCLDYLTNTTYSGDTWAQGGEGWINDGLELAFRYGSGVKMAFAGSGALLGIQRLVLNGATLTINVGQTDYGIKVTKWITPFGEIHIKTHPLFNFIPTIRNRIVVFEPKNLRYRFVTDTMFKADSVGWQKSGESGFDGVREEYLTQCGLEMYHPECCAIFDNVGSDNTLS